MFNLKQLIKKYIFKNHKRLKVFIMKFIAAIFVIALFLGGCHYINDQLGLEDDHPIEQMTEKILKHKTGLDIDLTPF